MGHRTPPRFATQTMATTFGTVVLILIVVLVVVTLIVRDKVRSTVIAHLTTQQGMLRTLEERRMSEMRAQAEMLAESPTVKAAMDTYHAESLLTGVAVPFLAPPTLRMDDNRYDTAAAPVARKSSLVAFARP